MQLRLECRPVGDVLIVQCHGRIVAGNEVFTLHSYVGETGKSMKAAELALS